MMRAGVSVLLVLGLLVVLGEGYSLKGYQTPQQQQQRQQQQQQQQQWNDYQKDDNRLVSSEEQQDDQSFIVPDDIQQGQVWSSKKDPDWILEASQETEDDDGSFIAPESTEEGELWSSDEDPDWTPTQSEEEESQYKDDDYYGDDYQSQEDQSYEQQTQEQYSQEQQSQEQYSQEQQSQESLSQEDQSQQDDIPFPEIHERPAAEYWSQQRGQDYERKLYRRNVKYPQVVQGPSPYEDWDRDEGGVREGVEPLVPQQGPKTDQVGVGVEPEYEESGGSRFGDWFRRGWRKITDKVDDTVGYIGDKVDYVAGEIHKTFETLDEKWDRIKNRFKSILKKFGILIREGVNYCLRRFQHSYDQARESEIIDKLEQKLEAGHAGVARFFEVLGEKIETWHSQERPDDIDEGLIIESYEQQQGQQQQMPDFYQDQDVIIQLNSLRDEGVLTQDDIIILTAEHTNYQQNYR